MMNNAGKPAYPLSCEKARSAWLKMYNIAPNGLNKRELFAVAAMQAVLSNPSIMADADYNKWAAKTAVKQADALLAELDK